MGRVLILFQSVLLIICLYISCYADALLYFLFFSGKAAPLIKEQNYYFSSLINKIGHVLGVLSSWIVEAHQTAVLQLLLFGSSRNVKVLCDVGVGEFKT